MALEKDLVYAIIAKELTKDDAVHYHVFCEFSKQLHIRNRKRLLINGCGVNIRPVGTKRDDKVNAILYLKKGDHYIEHGEFKLYAGYRGYQRLKSD